MHAALISFVSSRRRIHADRLVSHTAHTV